jgi:hypothetical protein
VNGLRYSRADLLACIDRELAFRQHVFARRVASGAMSESEAARERDMMATVRAVVAQALPPEQQSLFAPPTRARR